MAKLKIVDYAHGERLYFDLDCGMADKWDMTVGHNTRLVRKMNGSIALRLYDTDVVVIDASDVVTFHTGGYDTATTIERINHVAKKIGYVAYRQNGDAFIEVPGSKVRYELDGFSTAACRVGGN